jgi:tripartite-type tricarboxylate transporter receptor subunit TctC
MSQQSPLFRRRTILGMGAGFAASAAIPAFAQAYPSRPIRFVVPYAAGGGTDLLIRVMQDSLTRTLGQPIVVDNRAGAAGAIGAREVARSPADGYTFLVSNDGPNAIVPLLQKDAGYDPVKDFQPVTTIATAPIVLIANPSVPVTDLKTFVEWASSQAKGVTYASAGVGSIGHLAAEQFSKVTKLKFIHVPYRGQGPTVMAVLAGETQIGFTSASDALLAYIQAGKIRLLGVGSETPSPLIPGGIPIAATVPGYHAEFWQGVLAPARTPEAIIAKVHDALVSALGASEIQAKFSKMSYSVTHNTPAEFSRMLTTEVDTWRTLIRERGIQAES